MTYNEILSAAQSLSETERQSLLQALSVGNQCEARTTERNASSARIAAGLSPNIPARGSRSSTRKGL